LNDVAVAPADSVTATEPTVTVAPRRFVPFTVTMAEPFLPEAGVKEATVGAGGTTVNELVKMSPPPVVILIAPVVAPAGTTNVKLLPSLMTGLAVLFPPNTIAVALMFLPTTVTVAPTTPLEVAVVITGAWKMSLVEVTVPPAFVTLMAEPETTPTGIVTLIVLASTTVNAAATVPIFTALADPRFVPVRVKVEPTSFTNEAGKVSDGLLVAAVLALNAVVPVAVPALVVTLK